jgi:hypothetical protein
LGAQVVKIHALPRPPEKGRALYNGQSHLVELHGGNVCLIGSR